MTRDEQELIGAFELHSKEGIRLALERGIEVNRRIDGKLPIEWLTEMYSRGKAFPGCVRVLVENGAIFPDPAVTLVLLDDGQGLAGSIKEDPGLLTHRTSMVSAFTPLVGATLLHVAAEFQCENAVRALLEAGADVDAVAATDDFGLNGHTPIFHTVNSSHNRAEPILRLLIEAGAKTDIRLNGVTWGKGFQWETTLFDVTPVSYAQFGLLPQVHRGETDIYENIKLLLSAAERLIPPLENVPNKYLEA